jgi:hypothetical protein
MTNGSNGRTRGTAEYVRVTIVWLIVLAALFVLQTYFA